MEEFIVAKELYGLLWEDTGEKMTTKVNEIVILISFTKRHDVIYAAAAPDGRRTSGKALSIRSALAALSYLFPELREQLRGVFPKRFV